jgi:hypothetical protein
VAGLVALVLGPMQRAVFGELLRQARDMPPEAREIFENLRGGGSYVLMFFFQLFVGTLMAAIGGIVGAAYFKKEVPPALGGSWVPPMPPQ